MAKSVRTRTPSRKKSAPTTAAALLLVAVGTLASSSGTIIAAEVADAATNTKSCLMTGDNSAAFSVSKDKRILDDSQVPPSSSSSSSAKGEELVDDYTANCQIWPLPTGGVPPPEHRDDACDRARQNAAWVHEDNVANTPRPREELVPDTVYLNMPEERTWICPLEDDAMEESPSHHHPVVSSMGGHYGHPTRWILHNGASSPILLGHVNALGLEVSAHDFRTHPAHSNTAVYPHGPVVLPGQMAVVEGLQGQTFVAREYREDGVPSAADVNDDNRHHSWESFKNVLPPTLSILPQQTRYVTNKGILHVLGNPGRVLMRHRMGNIYVKNHSGAVCPELLGNGNAGDGSDDDGDGRRGAPKDMNPACNVLRKAFINRVGCPVDIYFAPQSKVEGYNCEKFTKHLGPLEPFLASDAGTRDIDARSSPLKFENTYNGHSFVARMSHDGTLVARMDIEHDVVRDCPEPGRGAGIAAAAPADARLTEGVPAVVEAGVFNATESALASGVWSSVGTGINASASSHILQRKPRGEGPYDLLWKNHTSVVSASVRAS